MTGRNNGYSNRGIVAGKLAGHNAGNIDMTMLSSYVTSMTTVNHTNLDNSQWVGDMPQVAHFGFHVGDKGTHTSRTMMLAELSRLLESVPGEVARADYEVAIKEDNCLHKRTVATRKLTFQRLKELYALDSNVLLFRLLRILWQRNESSRPLLALSIALARDPLLRATASVVLNLNYGQELSRQAMLEVLSNSVGHRFNESILDKIARNASSSWSQSGHLQGRVRKIRQRVNPTPASCTMALLLGYLLGRRGQLLFETTWVSILDSSPAELLVVAGDARRLGLLDLKQSASIIDISFPQLLSREDLQS